MTYENSLGRCVVILDPWVQRIKVPAGFLGQCDFLLTCVYVPPHGPAMGSRPYELCPVGPWDLSLTTTHVLDPYGPFSGRFITFNFGAPDCPSILAGLLYRALHARYSLEFQK